MENMSNEAINSAAKTSFSDEFLNMLRQWYSPHLHIGDNIDRLIINNIKPDNVHGVMYEYISKYTTVKGSSVLEVGCGSGQNIELWHRAGAQKIVTLDIIDPPVEITKQRCEELGIDNVEIFKADFIEHEFDQQYDIVNCVQVIEHVGKENQEKALRKLIALAKVGGIVFIQIPNRSCIVDVHDSHLPFAHWLPKSISKPYAKLFGRTPPTWDPMPYNKVKNILEENGGEVLNHIDLCDSVGEFADYRINKRRSVKNIIFAGIVIALSLVLGKKTNMVLPNINIFMRKVK